MDSRYDKSEPINYDVVRFDRSTLFVWSLCTTHHNHYQCNAFGMQNGENFDWNDVAKKPTTTATTPTTAMMTTVSNKLIDGIFFLFLISTQWYESVFVTGSPYTHSSFAYISKRAIYLCQHFNGFPSKSVYHSLPLSLCAFVFGYVLIEPAELEMAPQLI